MWDWYGLFYLCTAVFTPCRRKLGVLKFLKRTCAVALKNVYFACTANALYVCSVKMANTLIKLCIFFLMCGGGGCF